MVARPGSPVPTCSLDRAGRRFGTRVALHPTSLEVPPGQRVALVGPSGGGKSTLLRLIGGSLRATTGRVLVDGRDLASLSRRDVRRHRARCGVIAQGGLLVPQLSVHRNVTAGRLAHWPWWRVLAASVRAQERARTADLLGLVGLAERQWDRAEQLSGGQRQRVAIARGIASDPRLILADEPTASLDPTTAGEVIQLLLRVTAARNATLLVSTHWTGLVLAHVDRLLGIREGRVVLDTPAADATEGDFDALYAGSGERR